MLRPQLSLLLSFPASPLEELAGALPGTPTSATSSSDRGINTTSAGSFVLTNTIAGCLRISGTHSKTVSPPPTCANLPCWNVFVPPITYTFGELSKSSGSRLLKLGQGNVSGAVGARCRASRVSRIAFRGSSPSPQQRRMSSIGSPEWHKMRILLITKSCGDTTP